VKIARFLGSAALSALWVGSALAQVSIPLPQNPSPRQPPAVAAPGTVQAPATPLPLPGQSPPTEPAASATAAAPVPIGPHGRPDINPYNRDIDMTVPLTFLNGSLGEIEMRLTADDRFLLNAETFIRLMRPVLNVPAQEVLAARLELFESFGPDDLATTGVTLTYDPNTLSVVVVEVAPEQRAVRDLFEAPRDDAEDATLKPASFSAYLNLNLIQSYIWEGEDDNAPPPTVNFNGAARAGSIVFEGDAEIGEQVGDNGERYRLTRNYARLVYDQPKQFRRWLLGDLDPEVRGLQSFTPMGGVGVVRQKRRFNTFRSAILQGNRQLVLQRESTVTFTRNGTLYREMRLQPGKYDFSSLPLLAGSNDVQVQVRDNSGKIENLSFQQYLDPIDLDPGDHEYGAFLGPTSRRFGRAPDYKGPVAFSGFYRKAFFNKPALGMGLQVSEDVQSLSGQTQFVLGNGSRILLDAGLSNARASGKGYAAGISYDLAMDRGGLADNFSLRADYVSQNFATLGNPEGFNSNSLSATAQYTRQFSLKLLASITGSYLKSRGNINDSYRIGATGYYRLNNRWSLRAGADYAKFPTVFTRRGSFSVNFGLVFQPDYRRRAEARYESRDNLGELSYSQSGLNQLNSVGFGGIVARDDNSVRAQGFASYSGNRFDAAVSHATFGPNLSNFSEINATTLQLGTTLAFADGAFGVGRRINDSFALIYPHKNLGNRSVVAGQSLAENNYIGRSGALGAAVNNSLGSYVTQSIQYDVENPPTGYDIGPGVVRVNPPYHSGYTLKIGTDAFVSAMGTLALAPDKPVALIGGRVTLQDLRSGENPKPIPFFTNSVGRFAIANLLPGRRYVVETYGPNGTIDQGFEFTVPTKTDGLVDLGTVRPGPVQ